ncbi:MAG TPA: mannonate dehydratase [Chloroflexota bacterium]|nr:mannonate dehydratase [Chloroflexota bacterium]
MPARLIDQVRWQDASAERLNFLKATGVEGVLIHVPREFADGETHEADFSAMRRRVEAHGLELTVLHCGGLPKDKIVRGQEGREAQARNWAAVVRGIGSAGVPLTATTFQGLGHFRTPPTDGRGGAQYSTFRLAELESTGQRSWEHPGRPHEVITEAQMWDSLRWFYERVIPVAEEAGVRICLHPDDPPIPDPLGGAARITSSIENYHRIFDLVPGTANAMLFCQGCVAEMGVDIYDAIRSIGQRGKIGFVHFRDIRGTPYDFVETFIDEGQHDMLAAMQTYKEVGFEGPFMLDHTPRLPAPYDQSHGHAYANGYIKALIQVVYR